VSRRKWYYFGVRGEKITQQGPVMVPLRVRKGKNGTISKHDAPQPNLPRRNTTSDISHPQHVIHNALERPRYSDPVRGSLETKNTHREGRPSYPDLNEQTLNRLLAEVELLLAGFDS